MPKRKNEDQAIEESQPRKEPRQKQPKKRVFLEDRERIIELVFDRRQSLANVSRVLRIPYSTVRDIVKVYKDEGRVEPKSSRPPRHQKITEEHEQQILAWLNDNPTYTNKELAQKLEQQFGVHVVPSTVSKITTKNKLTFKMVH